MDFVNSSEVETTGSGLSGYIDVSYRKLVRVFGEPTDDGDGYKMSARWALRFADGTIATIYDYKDAKTYDADGLDTADITEWHIGGFGGFSSDAPEVRLVKEALAAAGDMPNENVQRISKTIVAEYDPAKVSEEKAHQALANALDNMRYWLERASAGAIRLGKP